jgi:hypothetical protein
MSTDNAADRAPRTASPDSTIPIGPMATGSGPTGHDHHRAATAPLNTSPRASDAERADTVARLHDALGAGRLDLAETDERVASAYAARYRHELTVLLVDLPRDDTSFTEAPTWAALWTLAVWRARTAVTGTAGPRPTASQQRVATFLTVLALVWMAACAVVGALVVGA